MELIKILSLILLFPSFFVAKKLVTKKDLNFFDLLIIFNTLYFVIIPLKSNQIAFNSIGRLTTETSVSIFFYLLFFFLSCLLASYLVKKNSDKPINITYYLNNYPNLKISLLFKSILIILPVFSITYYVPQVSYFTSFAAIQETNLSASYEQSSILKFFATIFRFGLIISIVVFVQNLKKKHYDILNIISLILFLVNFLMLPRRELLEAFLFASVVFYATNRELINKKFITYALVFGCFMYFIYFPFYNIIRVSPIEFEIQEPISSINDIYDYGMSNFDQSNEDAAEMTDTRAINLYKAIYLVSSYDSDKDITWGQITLSAIDHAIPKVLNPSKGLGSEITLQDRQHITYDNADSILLLALADYSVLGSIVTIIFFLLIYSTWLFISDFSEYFFERTTVSLYVVYSVFGLAFATEQKLDAILADTIAFVIMILLIVIVHKLNLIKIPSIDYKIKST